MKTLSRYEIRLNLIDGVSEFIRDMYADGVVDEGTEQHAKLQKMLAIYRTDTLRRMNNEPGSYEYLYENLKVGVRLAGSLMEDIQEIDGALLVGWHHGAEPQNLMQAIYSVLSETALELTLSIMEIEAEYPEWKWLFDLERAQYAEIQTEWQKQDEAEPA